VRVINPCTGLPRGGALVELLRPVTRDPVGSWTADASGVACGLPVGTWIMLISYPPIVGKRESPLTAVTCGGTTDVTGPASGVVRCWGFTCNNSLGSSNTTYTFTRSGQPTITASTGGAPYVDVILPQTGVAWSWTATAPGWNQRGPFNVTPQGCSTVTLNGTSSNGQIGDLATGKTCACTGFAGSYLPRNRIATFTDCKGTASVDIGDSGRSCGGSYCADRTFDNVVSGDPPFAWCWTGSGNGQVTLRYPSPGSGTVKFTASAFASDLAGTGPPSASIATPRILNRWTTGGGAAPSPSNPACSSFVYQKERFHRASNCTQTTLGGTSFAATSYTIHSHDPPVVEFFFSYPSDTWGPVADSAADPRGEPPCPSIIFMGPST